MTLAAPATATLTIGELTNKVKANLQNRQDVSETQSNPEMRPSRWIRDALREISANYDFEELRTTGPLVTIGPGLGYQGSNYAYPVAQYLWPGDDFTLTQDPVIFLSSQQAAASGLQRVETINTSAAGNLSAYSMNYLLPKAIQTELFVPGGTPFHYTRFGSNFWFGTQPGQPYITYLPYQVRHPINPDVVSTPIRLPQDWFNILSWAAAEIGAINLRWNDQANFIHTTLYGDPKSAIPGTGELARPGLIAAKILQAERDRRVSPVQIIPGAQRI
jgi:hypothetical protein